MAATFSPDERYRYSLTRNLDDMFADSSTVLFVMLNPSTADAEHDDPTVRRCVGYAKRWGYGMLHVANLFALRATDPAALYRDPDPVGESNDHFIAAMARYADRVVVAWGTHGAYQDRAREVARILRDNDRCPYALGLTKDGQPRHPLYMPADAQLEAWVHP